VTVRRRLEGRGGARGGAAAPRLETFAAVGASVEPDAPIFDSSAFSPEERKIA
jgi:hypothetical protein